jgi:hypothetical protein
MGDSNHERAVLDCIAASEQVDPERVSLGDKGAVFYRCDDKLQCLCQKGSPYWNDVEAEVIAAQAIARAACR